MAAAVENGVVRLVITYPDDQVIKTIFEERTENLWRSTTYTEQVPVYAPDYPIIGEDYKLKLFFKADAADTIVKADSTIKLSCIRHKTDKRGSYQFSQNSIDRKADLFRGGQCGLCGWVGRSQGFCRRGRRALQVGDFRGATMDSAIGVLFTIQGRY